MYSTSLKYVTMTPATVKVGCGVAMGCDVGHGVWRSQ
jgi:hypothetical protein